MTFKCDAFFYNLHINNVNIPTMVRLFDLMNNPHKHMVHALAIPFDQSIFSFQQMNISN